jgi:Flp pilus assembly protein protease CpaA
MFLDDFSRVIFTPGLGIPLTVVLVAVLIATVCDLRGFRIPNWLTLGLVLSGPLWNFQTHGVMGLLFSIAGGMISAAPLLLLYSRGVMGAGDVKLMGGIGAWLGAWYGLHVIIVAGVMGGVAGILSRIVTTGSPMAERKVESIEALVQSPDRRRYLIPFGPMILCGVIVNIVFPGIQQLAR